MNLLQPISSIMSTRLVTVHPLTTLSEVQELFDRHQIHHLPVVRYREIIGMISHTDLQRFPLKQQQSGQDRKAEDIMTVGLAKVNSTDTLRTAIEVFKLNRFHALPVVDDDAELVGIVTTHDLIKALSEEPIRLTDYQQNKQ